MSAAQFEVRVSRWLLLFLIAVGLLFLAAGLDIAVWHVVFGPETITNPIVAAIFAIFAIVVGVAVTIVETFNLIFPPLMLRVSASGVEFGTGMLYKPYRIPLQYLRSVAVYEQVSRLEVMGQRRVEKGGVELTFERTPAIPSATVTSAGLTYSDYTLRLYKMYMNRPLQRTVDAIRPFARRR